MTFSPGSGKASGKPVIPRATKTRADSRADTEALLKRRKKDQRERKAGQIKLQINFTKDPILSPSKEISSAIAAACTKKI
jgi:hypothetical protein